MNVHVVVLAALAASVASAPAMASDQADPPAPAAAPAQAGQVPPAVALAQAQQAPSTAPSPEDPRWTIGAGLTGLGERYLVTPTSPGLGTLGLLGLGTSVPVATLFIERRIGERTWLVFAGAGTVSRDRVDPPRDSVYSYTSVTEIDAERVSGSVGLRRVVTRPGAIVDLSVLASVEGGYLHQRQEIVRSGGTQIEVTDTGGFASASGGIAVERTLTGGLALRISTPLVGVTWSRVEREEDADKRDGSSFGVSVLLAPRIELRLAF